MDKRGKRDWEDTGELPEIPMQFRRGPESDEPLPEPEPEIINEPKRRKRHVLAKILLVIVLVAAIIAGGVFLLGERPGGAASGRQSVTVLVAGTDGDGARTDTIILVNFNPKTHALTLLSIPRDTYVDAPYSVPKINSAYGWVGFGEDGMEELCDRVADIVGFRPDGYVLVNLQTFADIVDLMGGVDFDVPQDMYYEDPYQDLTIALDAGYQHLDGEDALGVVRFRSGYAMADLRRVEVQRDFLKAALKQWATPKNVLKIPALYAIVEKEVLTDLGARNLFWFLRYPLSLNLDEAQNFTLPGTPQTINGGSYFVADEQATQALIDEYFS